MNTKEFNQLKKEVKGGNLKKLNKDVIQGLTLKQAQTLEDLMLDIELNKEGNKILDILVAYIDSLVSEEKKVANKKAPKKDDKKEGVKVETEEKKKASKSELKENKEVNILDQIKEGDLVKFRVEGEEIEHNIEIVRIGKKYILCIMTTNENEVFNIRKSDFKKQIFNWKDKHNNEYNIIVSL